MADKSDEPFLTPTEWTIMEELYDEQLTWGAAVGAVWPNLASLGLVQPNFGLITLRGMKAVQDRRARVGAYHAE